MPEQDRALKIRRVPCLWPEVLASTGPQVATDNRTRIRLGWLPCGPVGPFWAPKLWYTSVQSQNNLVDSRHREIPWLRENFASWIT